MENILDLYHRKNENGVKLWDAKHEVGSSYCPLKVSCDAQVVERKNQRIFACSSFFLIVYYKYYISVDSKNRSSGVIGSVVMSAFHYFQLTWKWNNKLHQSTDLVQKCFRIPSFSLQNLENWSSSLSGWSDLRFWNFFFFCILFGVNLVAWSVIRFSEVIYS